MHMCMYVYMCVCCIHVCMYVYMCVCKYYNEEKFSSIQGVKKYSNNNIGPMLDSWK